VNTKIIKEDIDRHEFISLKGASNFKAKQSTNNRLKNILNIFDRSLIYKEPLQINMRTTQQGDWTMST
jgi:hypothetical protein